MAPGTADGARTGQAGGDRTGAMLPASRRARAAVLSVPPAYRRRRGCHSPTWPPVHLFPHGPSQTTSLRRGAAVPSRCTRPSLDMAHGGVPGWLQQELLQEGQRYNGVSGAPGVRVFLYSRVKRKKQRGMHDTPRKRDHADRDRRPWPARHALPSSARLRAAWRTEPRIHGTVCGACKARSVSVLLADHR